MDSHQLKGIKRIRIRIKVISWMENTARESMGMCRDGAEIVDFSKSSSQHPHQSDKLDPDPHQFADNKPKCMEYEPI
jgi:hypothetical protein